MLRSTTAQKLLRCAAFCLAILAASLMTAAMFLDYEVDAHYFRAGAFLPVAALICALLLPRSMASAFVLPRFGKDRL